VPTDIIKNVRPFRIAMYDSFHDTNSIAYIIGLLWNYPEVDTIPVLKACFLARSNKYL
jgi:hypothetical protein